MKNQFAGKKIVAIFFIISLTILHSYGQNKDLSKQLIGEWRNVTLRVVLDSLNGTNPKKIIMANESNWEEKLNIEPIRTHFNSDHTYYSEYRNTKDSLLFTPKGTWTIHGDSITLHQTAPGTVTYKFRLKITGDIATFSGMIDFDEGGKNNDAYYGTQRKQH